MMAERKLVIHHVGGRGGDRRFPVIPAYERDVVNVLYDADPSSQAGMETSTGELTSTQTILPMCLGAEDGQATLRVLNVEDGSSLLPVNPAFFRTFAAIGQSDFDLDQSSFSAKTEIGVSVTTLDDCIEKGLAPAPDFLSINTQGTELDIVRGADKTLRDHTIAVQTEVSLFYLYDGQATVNEVVRHLHDRGYALTTILPHTPYVPSFAKRSADNATRRF